MNVVIETERRPGRDRRVFRFTPDGQWEWAHYAEWNTIGERARFYTYVPKELPSSMTNEESLAMFDRVLFLDIDGVLVTGSFLRGVTAAANSSDVAVEEHLIDLFKASLLNDLSDIPGLSIVLTSSWRMHGPTPEQILLDALDIPFHPDWRTTLDTPSDRSFKSTLRGWQIDQWLRAHHDVKKWAILDDQSDMLPKQRPNFVQTDFEIGLMPQHIPMLRDILEG